MGGGVGGGGWDGVVGRGRGGGGDADRGPWHSLMKNKPWTGRTQTLG